jgi:prophage DNA circulation protein
MSSNSQYQPAKFKGVEFHVRVHEAALGRRVQVHEYPQRDKPWAQDMGRRARELSLEAFVIGPNFRAQRDALLRVIEQPGPGTLVHPYLGALQCTVLSCKLKESTAEGGMARFALEFVEAGEENFPTAEVSTPAAVVAGADYAALAARANFERRFSTRNRPAFVAEAAQGILSQALGAMQGAVKQVRGVANQVDALNRDIEAAKRDLITVIFTPASAAQALAGNLRQLVRNVTTAPRDAVSLARVFFNFGSLLPAVPALTVSRRAQAVNQAEAVRLVRATALAEGARASSALQFESFQEAAALRDELADGLEDLLLQTADDATFDALRTLRAALVKDINARGANLARVVAWTPAKTLPALVAAQSVYSDSRRAAELLVRNDVRHPLFLAGGQPLEVLSDAA